MTDKDPKDMTVSEQLRWAANGEPYNGIDENIWTYPTGKIRALEEAVTGEWPSDNEIFSIVADKIDAELAQARELSLRQGAELWAKANGWPDFREGEDFGAWLDRCALKLPCDKDGEPWSIGDRVMPGNRSESTVTGYSFDGADWFLKYRWCGIDSYANEFATSCKRPAPEVLGADALPIEVGDTVWLVDEYSQYAGSNGSANGNKYSLLGVDPQETLFVEYDRLVVSGKNYVRLSTCNAWCHASWLTHTPPDTKERIDEDALKSCVQYWGCNDFSCGKCPALIDGKKPVEFYELDPIHDSCHEAQKLDLLRRQRELDKRTGGAE